MTLPDSLLAVRIRANLIADRSIGLMEIQAHVHDGVATLIGEVETNDQRRLAEEIASNTPGVASVRNQIHLLPQAADSEPEEVGDAHMGYGLAEGTVGDTAFEISGAATAPGSGIAASEQFAGQFTDYEIEEDVAELLATQQEIDASQIQAFSANQVHIKGAVKDAAALNRLQEMVLQVRGVMGVKSKVTVKEGEIGTPTE